MMNAEVEALKTLLDGKIDRFPVDIDTICENLGVKVFSYDIGAEVIERAHLYRAVRDTDGLAFYLKDTPVILFNERRELRQIMFTVAHELGHIVLKHVKPGDTTTIAHQGVKWNATPKETEANQFAARLLAPPNVLWSMGIRKAEEIMKLCRVPKQAAEYSALCITQLSRRKVTPLDSMEQAVYRQFQLYIKRMWDTKWTAV